MIPAPVSDEISDGFLFLPVGTHFIKNSEESLLTVIETFRKSLSRFEKRLKFVPKFESDIKSSILRIRLDKSQPYKPEEYHLHIESDGISIYAGNPVGVFRGLNSLLQLIHESEFKEGGFLLQNRRIRDYPQFRWRGMHLDVARHFFPVDVIKNFLDILAFHKFTVFHWHLTDDQGWRIPISKWPRLTEIGAWRKETNGGNYGGYYSHDEVREIVSYAAERHIEIIPEIEIPGHSLAAIASYPQLSCSGKQVDVPSTWGIFDNVLCVGTEETYDFLKDVFEEVADLFPGKYVHIGGDECPTSSWENCPRCHRKKEKLGIKSYRELHGWFCDSINNILDDLGKKLIGWDEIIDAGVSEDATVMVWRDIQTGKIATDRGNNVVMCPTIHCYFDYAQAKHGEPKSFDAVLTLEKVYEFDPSSGNSVPVLADNILGGQGNIWTEYIDTETHLQYMMLPRASALSEVLWSQPEIKDIDQFKTRLEGNFPLFDRMNWNYRKVE